MFVSCWAMFNANPSMRECLASLISDSHCSCVRDAALPTLVKSVTKIDYRTRFSFENCTYDKMCKDEFGHGSRDMVYESENEKRQIDVHIDQ